MEWGRHSLVDATRALLRKACLAPLTCTLLMLCSILRHMLPACHGVSAAPCQLPVAPLTANTFQIGGTWWPHVAC